MTRARGLSKPGFFVSGAGMIAGERERGKKGEKSGKCGTDEQWDAEQRDEEEMKNGRRD